MIANKKCPLCGKQLNDNENLCDECQNHVDNQYELDLIENVEDEKISSNIENKENEGTGSETKSIQKRKKTNGIVFLGVFSCIILIIIGFSYFYFSTEQQELREKEDSFWQECVRENRAEAYANYLLEFRDGRYVAEAEKQIREIRKAENSAWEDLKKSSDINDFYAFLSENPKTPYAKQAKVLMDSLSWLDTEKENTADGYRAYLENVKIGNLSGNYIDIAQDRYTYLSQIKIIEGSSLDSIRNNIADIFEGLSQKSPQLLLKLFAPEVSLDDSDSKLSSTAVVSKWRELDKKSDVRERIYTPVPKSILAKRDNKNVVFIDLLVEKNTIYNTKVKKGKKTEYRKESTTDTFKIELNNQNQIQAISIRSSNINKIK